MLPRPSVSNIAKNNTAHRGETGILTIASVKAMNVRPGPWADYRQEKQIKRISTLNNSVRNTFLGLYSL